MPGTGAGIWLVTFSICTQETESKQELGQGYKASERHTSSSKTASPKCSMTSLNSATTTNQAFTFMNLWGAFLIQTTQPPTSSQCHIDHRRDVQKIWGLELKCLPGMCKVLSASPSTAKDICSMSEVIKMLHSNMKTWEMN